MKLTPAACFLALSLVATPILAGKTGSPVEQVVHLLEDLKSKLDLDERQEQQMYDKYACWCEKTSARKAEDITTAQEELRNLGQTILTLKGRIATLASEIEELNSKIKAAEDAMAQATSIRQKENGAYMAESEELKSCLVTLQEALTVLIAGSSQGAFLQSSEKLNSAVKGVIAALPSKASLKASQYDDLAAFVQAGGNSKYMPQSFTVQGILVDMYTTFASDLEKATQAEATANRDFEDFMHQKSTQIARFTKQRNDRLKLKAEAESKLADTQSIYDETDAQRKADIKFFDETKAACMAKHNAWSTRSELRKEEIDGVEKALEILTKDENRERFEEHITAGMEVRASDDYDTGRDITAAPPSFLQRRSRSTGAEAASHAYATLKRQATKAHSLRLAALAARLSLTKTGHFEEVIAAIDAILKTLEEEGNADVQKRDQCKDEYFKIESTVKNVTWLIEKNEAKIAKLTQLIEKREQQKAETIQKIDETKQYKIDLTTERTAENTKFLADKAADQKNIDALMQARSFLMAYYKKNKIDLGPIQGSVKALALSQQGPDFEISADQAPDTVFSGKGKRKDESKGIVSILTMLIEDINDEIKNDMKDEEEAQLTYEGLIAEADALLKSLEEKKQSLITAIAKRKGERTDEEDDMRDNKADLKAEVDYKASITDDCDFIIRTFEKRAAARQAEKDGLWGAKDYLAGATTPAPGLLQTGADVFDDGALPSARFLGLGR